MKHTLTVTFILVGVFLLSQLVGLSLIAAGSHVTIDEEGNRVVTHDDTALGPRPETQGFASFTYLIVGLAIGTIVLLILIKFRLFAVWKLWFFVAVWLAMTVSIGALVNAYIAAGFAAALAIWKIWRPNVWIHNLTEVLVYSGIGLLVAPIIDLFYASLLLILIAAYDAYAVWRSKHMIAMAQFQTESKLFAGLLVPYGGSDMNAAPKATAKKVAAKTAAKEPVQEGRNAILGGGDIAFPLLFAGVVLNTLLQDGLTKTAAFGYTLFVVGGAAAALFLLFVYAKKNEFYPAMPFIAAGCFVGYGLVWLFV
jgi:presenilin-like A22 family membrane protease